MTEIFVSYSHRDKAFAEKLSTALQDRGLEPWIDWMDIPPISDWWEQIQKGIESADAFVFLLSPDSIESEVCKDEIDHAVRNGKRLIPLIIRDVTADEVHESLRKLNWIFFREADDFNTSLKKLETAIKTDLTWVEVHRRLQVRAVEWQKRTDRSRLLRGKDLDEAEEQLANAGQKDPQPTNLQRQYVLESRRRERQTRNGVLIAGLVITVLLAFLTAFAFNQSNRANENALTAVANQQAAQTARADAVSQQETAVANEQEAVRQSHIAVARQLAVQAAVIFGEDFESQQTAQESYGMGYYDRKTLAVLLAAQSMKIFPSLEAAEVLQKNNLLYPLAYLTEEDSVTSVAFSPNGRFVVYGSGDLYSGDVTRGVARVWDVLTAQEISSFKHDGAVRFVAFSTDGERIISAGANTMYLWDASTGREIIHWPNLSMYCEPAVSSKYIVCAGGHTLYVWDAKTGAEVASFEHETGLASVDFSPDTRFVATGDTSGNIRVWDIESKTIHILLPHGLSIVNSLDFSPDGKRLVSGGQDAEVRVWDIEEGNTLTTVEYFNPVGVVAFSPDGKYIISSSDDGLTQVSDASSGRIMHILSRPIHEDGEAAFSSDGRLFLAARSDSHAIFETETGLEIGYFPEYDFPIRNVGNITLSSDGRFAATLGCLPSELITGCEKYIAILWGIAPEQELPQLHFPNADSNDYELSMDGTYLVPTRTFDEEDHVYDLRDGSVVYELSTNLSSISISPNGKFIAAIQEGDTLENDLYVWDIETGAELVEISDVAFWAEVSFSPDSTQIAAIGVDQRLHIWQIDSGKETASLQQEFPITTFSFSQDEKHVVTIGEDNIARVWDRATGIKIFQKPHDDKIVSATLSPNGAYLLTSSYSVTRTGVYVWKMDTGQQIIYHQYNTANISDYNVQEYFTAATFSFDDQYLAVGDSHGTILIFELASGIQVGSLYQNREIEGLAFHPDGKYLASAGFDGSARVWDISLRQEIASSRYDGSVSSVGFSADGDYVFAWGCSDLDMEGNCGEMSARAWKWRPIDLIEDACLRLPRNLTRSEWDQYVGGAMEYEAVCSNLPIESPATSVSTDSP